MAVLAAAPATASWPTGPEAPSEGGDPDQDRATRTRCPRCRIEVVAVELSGSLLTVLVEVPEIDFRQRCPTCLSARQLKFSCWRCHDSRWIGEDLTGVLAVAVDAHGSARLMPYGADDRRRGEAVQRAHRCR